MIWRIITAIVGLWCLVYTASYGVFEYKRKNPLGTTGVFALCTLILIALGGMIISVI